MTRIPFQAVIFDVDGTLVDSNDAHARSWVEALAEQGYEVTFEDIRRRIGMGGDNLLPEVIGKDKDSPEGETASERRKEIFQTKYLPGVKPFAGITDLVDAVTSSSDAGHSKPDPAPVAVALQKAGVEPGQALMVGDTPFDIESARKAGVGAIAVRCGGFRDEDLGGAVAVYDDPADILRQFAASPLAGSEPPGG